MRRNHDNGLDEYATHLHFDGSAKGLRCIFELGRRASGNLL
jgi:hypothetical protein